MSMTSFLFMSFVSDSEGGRQERLLLQRRVQQWEEDHEDQQRLHKSSLLCPAVCQGFEEDREGEGKI